MTFNDKKIKVNNQKLKNSTYWDRFVDNSINGTIFHKKSFLEYHKNKFEYRLLTFSMNDKIIAGIVFVLQNNIFKSPIGASYGGIVFSITPLHIMNEVFIAFVDWAKKNKLKSINITCAPTVYTQSLNQDTNFLFLYHNFKLVDIKFSSVINLKIFGSDILESYSTMGRRAIKKSFKSELIASNNSNLESYYKILQKNKMKFGVKPAHTLNELRYLQKSFPEKINIFEIFFKDEMIAGITTIHCNPKTLLAFYIASNPNFHEYRPVNRCLHEVVKYSIKNNYEFLDLGVSMNTQDDNIMEPAWSLISFKEFTGARGYLRNSYKLTL